MSAVAAPTVPSTLSVWAIPTCSKVSSKAYTGVATNCSANDSSPVTWTFDFTYGMFRIHSSTVSLLTSTLGYLGLAGGVQAPFDPSATTSTGFNYVSLNSIYLPNQTALYLPALLNIAQVFAAAICLDLGDVSPNNVITKPEIRNASLYQNFPNAAGDTTTGIGSFLYYSPWFTWNSPIPADGAYILTQYECRFVYPLSWGESNLRCNCLRLVSD